MQLGAPRSFERWAAGWARRRQGADAHAVEIKRRRIYVLPTRFGIVFGAMVFAMLLGSLNYGASLGFTLTFLLASLGVVAMHHCHNNLLGTEIKFLGAVPVFAGDRADFKIAVSNRSPIPRLEIELKCGDHAAGPTDVGPGATETLRLGVPTERRGSASLDRFRVETRYPARLFRAWTWVHMDARCLVYPRPAAPGRPLPLTAAAGAAGLSRTGDEDFAGLRSASASDPPQRIAWKAYARSDVLLLKEFSGGTQEPCMLDWDMLPDLLTEDRLSQLTRWCLDADAAGRNLGLRLPGYEIPLGAGPKHLAACLEALALYDEDTAARGRATRARAWMPEVEQRTEQLPARAWMPEVEQRTEQLPRAAAELPR
jgi:uncharacterized protein (DUF58 family)